MDYSEMFKDIIDRFVDNKCTINKGVVLNYILG